MKSTISLFYLLGALFSFSQTVNYDDVAVIVNDNSQVSLEIGSYFQQERNIPVGNIIHVTAPTTEEIDSAQFEVVRAQIEDALLTNGLESSINYLVTTKGVPLTVEGDCFQSVPNSTDKACASFDSELTLLLSPWEDQIGVGTSIPNPYGYATDNFSRDSVGIFLVTRLDGYTKFDVFNLIDQSGPNTGINNTSAVAILDANGGLTSQDLQYFQQTLLGPAMDSLSDDGWNVVLDSLPPVLLNQQNVFAYGYASLSPSNNVNLNYTWTKGAIATLSTCNSANTFDANNNPQNQLILADLIADGATCAHGYADCIFFAQLLRTDLVFDRYFDPNSNFNLAESYYIGEPSLSTSAILIGDPKASVVADQFAKVPGAAEDLVLLFPNPSNGILNVHGGQTINSIDLIDANGRLVKEFTEINSKFFKTDLGQFADGVYLLEVASDQMIEKHRIVLTK